MMRTLLITALTVALGSTAFACPQVPDKIIYNGKEYELPAFPLPDNPLGNHPLEIYFEKNPDERLQERGLIRGVPLFLHRGYVATFEIKDNQLYVKDIEILEGKEKSVMQKVFPNQKSVKIDWATGLIALPTGKMTSPEFLSLKTYDNYILLEIKNGDVAKTKTFQNAQEYAEYRERLFQAFKKTGIYKEMKKEWMEREFFDQNDFDSWVKARVQNYTPKLLVD